MFILIAIIFVNGLAENPTFVVHEFKSKAACETAGEFIVEQAERTGIAKAEFKCTPNK